MKTIIQKLAILFLVALAGQTARASIIAGGGYSATDSTTGSFIDISSSGTQVLGGGIDDATTPAALPFSFPFFGSIYNSVSISTNGILWFGNGSNIYNNSSFASTVPQNDEPAIAALWDDLYTLNGIYTATQGTAPNRVFIVQWNVRPLADSSGGAMTFEAQLFESSGDILLVYPDADTTDPGTSNGASATVGIRNMGAPSNGQELEWSNDAPVIASGSRIRFRSGLVARADAVYMTNPVPVAIDVLANDSLSPSGGTLSITNVTNPAIGTVQIFNGGTAVAYTPADTQTVSNWTGVSFSYTISDGLGGSSTATVNIRNPYLDFGGAFQGLLTTGDPAHNGYVSLTLTKLGAFTGSLRTLGGIYGFRGAMDGDGQGTATITRIGKSSLTVTLAMDFSSNGAYDVSVDDGSGPVAGTLTQNIVHTPHNPSPRFGKFTMLLPAAVPVQGTQATAVAVIGTGTGAGKIISISVTDGGSGYISTPKVTIQGGAVATATVSNGQVTAIKVNKPGSKYLVSGVAVSIDPPSGLPQGTGYATMKVGIAGNISCIGKLGDGATFTASSWMDANTNRFPLFTNVYSAPPGCIYGTLIFENLPGESDFDGTLQWYKPAQTKLQMFNGGFSTEVNAIGSNYQPPSTGFVLSLINMPNNALVTMSGGNLAGDIQNSVSFGVAPTNLIATGALATNQLQLKLVGISGLFSGSFLPSIGKRATPCGGVVFQKQNLGAGVFNGATQTGVVTLTPQ